MALREVKRMIDEDNYLIPFEVPIIDVAIIVEAICSLEGYQPLIQNPDFKIGRTEDETNAREITNPVTPETFTMGWIIRNTYNRVYEHNTRKAEIKFREDLEASRIPINAKIAE